MRSYREAREYVERLLEIAEQGGEVEAVGKELEELRQTVESSAAVYQELERARRGAKRAVVEIAVPLTAEQEARLAEALEQLLGAPMVIEQQNNPEIIGGLRVIVDDTVIDNTLRGRLQGMLASVHQAPVDTDTGDVQ